MQLTPVFVPGRFHGQRSLGSCSSWGLRESNTAEQLNTHTHTPSDTLRILETIKYLAHVKIVLRIGKCYKCLAEYLFFLFQGREKLCSESESLCISYLGPASWSEPAQMWQVYIWLQKRSATICFLLFDRLG